MHVLTSLNTLMQSSAHAVAMNPLHNDLTNVQQNNIATIQCITLEILRTYTYCDGELTS